MSLVVETGASSYVVARTDVAALNGGLGGTETQTDVLVPSAAVLARSGGLGLGLRVEEDVRLLLESTLRLDGQFGRPEVGKNSQQNSIASRIVVRSFGESHILNDPAPGDCRYKRTCRLGWVRTRSVDLRWMEE